MANVNANTQGKGSSQIVPRFSLALGMYQTNHAVRVIHSTDCSCCVLLGPIWGNSKCCCWFLASYSSTNELLRAIRECTFGIRYSVALLESKYPTVIGQIFGAKVRWSHHSWLCQFWISQYPYHTDTNVVWRFNHKLLCAKWEFITTYFGCHLFIYLFVSFWLGGIASDDCTSCSFSRHNWTWLVHSRWVSISKWVTLEFANCQSNVTTAEITKTLRSIHSYKSENVCVLLSYW